MHIPSGFIRFTLLPLRGFQWVSALIVMGICSYFIDDFTNTGLVTYEEVIAVLSVVFFLPGLVSPFMPRIGAVSFPIDLIFSYLWLTSFIIMSLDYSRDNCFLNAPLGGKCSIKRANQAFAFLTFFCTLCSAVLEVLNLWVTRKGTGETNIPHTKETTRPSGDTEVTGTTAGAETSGAAPATTTV